VILLLAGVAVMSACSTRSLKTAVPTPSTEIKSLLWVGNSFFYYNNSMHDHAARLMVASGAAGLRNSSATITHDKLFDGVMMMDCSQCPVLPKLQPLFHEYIAKHSATARKHGAAPILFMSWAYGSEMTAKVAAEYIKAGKQNHALVVPVGLAFANAIAERPDLDLYAVDRRHPSLMGTYLAACTVVASVYKTNPIGATYTAGLPDDVAAFLQRVAWDTSQTFHAKEGRGGL